MLHSTSWVKNLKTPIAVIGLGKSGLSALQYLKLLGYSDSDLITYDDKKPTSLGFRHVSLPHELTNLFPRTLVVSPGVSLKTSWIQQLAMTGALITSELSLASALLTTEKLIGVTGSVAKSTVTSLLGVGAAEIDKNCFVGGNLGIPFCDYAAGLLSGRPKADWVVLELSSYQLENCAHLKFEYSAITFLSPNHLERYNTLEEYYQTKLHLTQITKNICFFNSTSEDAALFAPRSDCAHALINAKSFSDQNLLASVQLIGPHNKDNFALAAELGQKAGWPNESFAAMAKYQGLPHRLEFVTESRGVKYINDSKATALDSVIVAAQGCLEQIADQSRLFLLLGGKDKNLPWKQLSFLKSDSRITFVFFGACGPVAQKKSDLAGEVFDRLQPALESCFLRASAGDTVLLSPGGTSLDEFKNFEDRGEFFKNLVIQKSAKS